MWDASAYPAYELICAYSKRWEVEIMIDEADTHQHPPPKTCRSRTPVGVLQEFYELRMAHYCVRQVMPPTALSVGLFVEKSVGQ